MTIHGRVRLFHPDVEHQCCRIALRPPAPARGWARIPRLWARIRRRSLGEPYQCGQDCGHGGDCTWWMPGSYLSPPLITPLALFDTGWDDGKPWLLRCPLCGDGIYSGYKERTLVIYGDAEDAERDEIRWEMRPCGCVGREFA